MKAILITLISLSSVITFGNHYYELISQTDSHYVPIRGKVISKHDKSPLIGAHIFNLDNSYSVIANEQGEFIYKLDTNKIINTMTIPYIGFKNKRFLLKKEDHSDSSFIVIELEKLNINFTTLDFPINSSKNKKRKKQPKVKIIKDKIDTKKTFDIYPHYSITPSKQFLELTNIHGYETSTDFNFIFTGFTESNYRIIFKSKEGIKLYQKLIHLSKGESHIRIRPSSQSDLEFSFEKEFFLEIFQEKRLIKTYLLTKSD